MRCPKWTLTISLVSVVFLTLTACGEAIDEPALAPVEQIQQPIMNGTVSPTVVPLTSGEQLAIGYLWDGAVFCSGTLIDRDVVLTAQHCIDSNTDDKPDSDIVGTVTFRIGSPENVLGSFEVSRASVVGWEHDIALLHLSEDAVSAVPALSPIPFNRVEPAAGWEGRVVEAAGFSHLRGIPHVRRYGELRIMNHWENIVVTNGDNLRALCVGDSGGPLLTQSELGDAVVMGVNIQTDSGCVGDSYHALTDRVTDWIDEETRWFNAGERGTGGVDGRWVELVCSTSPARSTAPSWWVLLGLGVLVLRRRSTLESPPDK